jgi:hypothetical protein
MQETRMKLATSFANVLHASPPLGLLFNPEDGDDMFL